MVNPIPVRARRIWEHWNIRGAVLLSLFLQVLLIMLAPVRKRTGNKAIMLLIWSAYLLADAVANFAIGLIFNSQGNPPSSPHSEENSDLLAMWAPFLLVHLGGPDTITAFALEDNQLWLRHLLSFVVQAAATGYVFLQTLPRSKLIVPTLLLFVSGFIKYLERTCSLYMASKEKFRDSLLRKPEPGVDYAGLVDVYGSRLPDPDRLVTRQPSIVSANATASDAEMGLVLRAYRCFIRLRGLIVDLPVRAAEYEGIHNLWEDMKGQSERALRMIEVELNFFYDVLYTKAVVVHSRLGTLCRSISLVSVISAFLVFRLHVKKHGYFDAFDVGVTYALLCGALALDGFALVKAFFSDWTLSGALEIYLDKAYPTKWLSIICNGIIVLFSKLPVLTRPRADADQRGLHVFVTPFVSRRWSGYVSGFDLISYCVKRSSARVESCCCTISSTRVDKLVQWVGLRDLLNELRYKSKEPLTRDLWEFTLQELRTKSMKESAGKLIEARGEWVLGNGVESEDFTELKSYIVDVAFDESLLTWHIATELLHKEKQVLPGDDSYKERYISKILSDYMMYLVIMRPTMMEAVSSSDQILRFQDTCAEAERFFKTNGIKPTQVKTACKMTLGLKMEIAPKLVKGPGESMSVFFEANMLAKELTRLNKNKWKVLSRVWIEMLSYAASHCSSSAHAQQISRHVGMAGHGSLRIDKKRIPEEEMINIRMNELHQSSRTRVKVWN